MTGDTLIFVVGVFVTFLGVWGGVLYGVLVAKERRRAVAESEPAPDIVESASGS